MTNSGNQVLTLVNITLNNASGVTFNAGTGANIAVTGTIAELAAGSDVVKSGSGTLTLGGAGSYTGDTRITAGILAISHGQALGTTDAGTSISASATLQLDGGTTGLTITGEALSIAATTDATYLQSNGASTNVWTGNMTLNVSNNLRFNAGTGNTLRITGNIATTGSGLLVLQGAGSGELTGDLTGTANLRIGTGATGVWTLSGNNTFTGQTIASNGTLSVTSIATNLGNPTGGNSIIGLGGGGFTGRLRHTGAAESTSRILSILGTNNGNGGELQAMGGALTWAGDVRVVNGADAAQARTLTLNAGNSGVENLFSGKITNTTDGTAIATGTLGVTKTGTGTWVLSGSNSYKGATTVSAGILIIESSTALGTTDAGTTVLNNAALRLRNNITVTGESLNLTGAGVPANTTGSLINESGNNVWNGALTMNTSAAHVRIGVEAGTMTLQGTINLNGLGYSLVLHGTGGTIESTISGAGGIIRSSTDAGTWTLTGNNTYTGDTLISRGTLLVNNTAGSDTGSGNVNVTSTTGTSILGGTGTIVPGAGKKVTIGSNGSLQAGNNTGDTTGTLTISGELVFTSAGSAQFQIAGKNAGDYDQVIVTNGPVTLDGVITVVFTGGFTAANVAWGDEWKLFDWGAIAPTHTDFDAALNSELALPTLTGGLIWDRSLFETQGIIRAVPEPGRGLLLLLACMGFLGRRRRF